MSPLLKVLLISRLSYYHFTARTCPHVNIVANGNSISDPRLSNTGLIFDFKECLGSDLDVSVLDFGDVERDLGIPYGTALRDISDSKTVLLSTDASVTPMDLHMVNALFSLEVLNPELSQYLILSKGRNDRLKVMMSNNPRVVI